MSSSVKFKSLSRHAESIAEGEMSGRRSQDKCRQAGQQALAGAALLRIFLDANADDTCQGGQYYRRSWLPRRERQNGSGILAEFATALRPLGNDALARHIRRRLTQDGSRRNETVGKTDGTTSCVPVSLLAGSGREVLLPDLVERLGCAAGDLVIYSARHGRGLGVDLHRRDSRSRALSTGAAM